MLGWAAPLHYILRLSSDCNGQEIVTDNLLISEVRIIGLYSLGPSPSPFPPIVRGWRGKDRLDCARGGGGVEGVVRVLQQL